MQKYLKIIEEMKAGRCLLIDGATATEMERRGVPQLEMGLDNFVFDNGSKVGLN